MSTSARRQVLTTLTVIAALVLALYFAGPWALRQWAQNHFTQTLGQPVRVSHLSFNPFTRTADFTHLRIGEVHSPMILVGHGEATFEWSTLWQSGVHLSQVSLDSPRLRLVSPDDGALNVTRLGASDDGSAPNDSTSSQEGASSLTIERLSANDGRIDWTDRRGASEASVSAFGIDLALKDYARGSDSPMQGEMSGEFGEGSFTLKGQFGIAPFTGDLDLQADKVALATVQPWLDPVAALRIRRGSVSGEGRVRFGEAGALAYQGGVGLTGLALQNEAGTTLLTLDRGDFEGLDWQLGDHLIIDATTLSAPDLMAQVSAQGEFNLTAPFSGGKESGNDASQTSAGEASAASDAAEIALALQQVTVEQGVFEFEDHRMDPVVALDVSSIAGEIEGFDTRSANPARFHFQGAESDRTPVMLEGNVGFGEALDAHLRLTSQRLTLQQFAPYFRQLAGYRIDHGIADLDLDYRLKGERLSARNHIVLHRLDLGEEVAPGETSLPLKNFVALLQGESGEIDLDIPIDTTIDGSRVDVSVVVWQAITESLENLITSPVDTLQAVINSGE
ncbi:DUF748 domain-containing protein [Salinicola aestuarinus]|uniref:DUF748 domain-containing protein n=1 Tax=Salinicola aestuarinus TaxID=1949082 RepID=UPI00165F0842|nr:DUF748 domain-containing protein [Salinicola aestuarinus]